MLRKTLSVVVTIAAMITLSVGGHSPSAQAAGAKCGGGLTASLTPALQGSYNFTLVCVQHDKCYAHFGISKGDCDSAFIGNMLAECAHAYPTTNNVLSKANKSKRHSCEYVAGRYHIAVAQNGEAAYQKAQKQAAVLLFNGDYHGVGSVTTTVTDSYGPVSNTLPITDVTVQNGSVQVSPGIGVGSVPLVITTDPPLSAAATASWSVPLPGFTGNLSEDFTFNYSLNGPATVSVTISYNGTDTSGLGATVTQTGSFSGSN